MNPKLVKALCVVASIAGKYYGAQLAKDMLHYF